ncbi:Protein of unknown function [Bacillus cereus]|nr:Protein of unknown function [Bacillus cereus]
MKLYKVRHKKKNVSVICDRISYEAVSFIKRKRT